MKFYTKKTYNYFILLLLVFFFINLSFSQTVDNTTKKDTTKTSQQLDTIIKPSSSSKLKYPFTSSQKGSLFLNKIKNLEVIYDPDRGHYIFLEKVGNYYIEHPFYMTQEEYKKYRLQKDMLAYFKEKSTAFSSQKNKEQAQKNLLPKYYVRSEFFENIFGGNEIEVNPQGSVLVKLGLLYQKVENPQLSERNRSSRVFDFDQEISASLNAKVGKRLRVNAAFDTQSTFNFQNQIKLEYTPTEDDIIRKIEVGNVNMPVQSSLIAGAQNLFGVKTQLQFGKTTVTGVFSQQRSQTRSVAAQGGATINEFDLRASDYDDNRHFFLSHQFRNDYNAALNELPLIKSSKYITRIEVWITNRNNTTEDVRNIVALADLGETDRDKFTEGATISPTPGVNPGPRNGANTLRDRLINVGDQIRDISTVEPSLSTYNIKQGSGFSVLENARKLTLDVDFTLNPQLGYITLNKELADSDILAVAYEYTDNSTTNPETGTNVFRVGELSGDGVTAPSNLVVKLLRSEILNPGSNLWDLMMKNVYVLPGAYQLQRDGFRLEVLYRDDETGVPINYLQNAKTVLNGEAVSEIPLLNLLRLDVLDATNTNIEDGDGYFDFIEGVTVNSELGYIMFPTIEPFGGKETPNAPDPLTSGELGEILTNPADSRFIFQELYTKTQAQAQNEDQNKDKYFLRGYFKSESQSGIPLGVISVSPGSVRVTSGGRELVENVDYIVNAGSVQVINPNLIASNAPINVSVENNNGFNQQNRRFMGVDVQHIFSDKFAIGGTVVNLNERPFTQKPQFGAEPVNNTIVGFNLNYETEVPSFTKWVNKLPNIDTDAPSNFSLRAEAAYLLPGSPKGINLNGEAASYVDDFEGSQIPLDISSPRQWFLASVPQYPSGVLNFSDAQIPIGLSDRLRSGAERSQLAWYTIDRLFYGTQLRPSNIDDNELSRAEVRRVGFEELFPQLQLDVTQSNIINTFDLAYYPNERGSYNFNQNVSADGVTYTDNRPEDKWAGIMRAINTTDFQQANVEYIQFWLMDPYVNYSISQEEGAPATINPADFGGELYLNLGNISEDILDDNRRMYENGLPENGIKINGNNIVETEFGDVPKNQSLIYAFTEEDSERPNQDIGLDGLKNEEERIRFGNSGSNIFGSLEDPSNDDYQFFRGGILDNEGAGILKRYKRFNNTQGNSPTINNSAESYPTSATSFPDIEDINQDQTMSDVESFYSYRVSLNPADLVKGQNNIVDEKIVPVTLANGQIQEAKWYQFRIPVTSGESINGISGFNAIRFIRMFLTKFKVPVVLRFGELELVRGDWRRYLFTVDNTLPNANPQPLTPAEDQNFEVGVVNIEENEKKQPFPYVLPPGVRRERLQGSTSVQQQNEQSLLVKVNDLSAGETRLVFKNTTYDMRMFNKIKMYVHAASIPGQADIQDSDMTAVLRLGTDTKDNFYQIELPLKITKTTETSADSIWKNNLEADLKALGKLKLERYSQALSANELFPTLAANPNARIRVNGNPNLQNIRTLMIGVRNDANTPKSAELWFNELRVTDFDNEGGWAAVVNADANFADFADVSISGRANSQGFGSIDQRPQERSQEDVKQYDIVTNVNLGQLLPKKVGIKIPFNYSIGEEFRDPRWDPQFQDVLFKDAVEANENSENSRDYTKRKSINVINVRKERTNPEKKQRFYDVENLSVSYSYNETFHRDYNIKRAIDQNVRASANYNYGFQPLTLEPLKKWKVLDKSAYLRLFKDINFNLLPTTISVNTNINRSFSLQESRSLSNNLANIELPVLRQHRYFFDWDYNIAYNLTKSLQFNFRAANNYVYDSFNDDGKEAISNITLFSNFFNFGRPNNYHQTLDANYKLPFDKIPILDFINATYNYKAEFDWQAPARDLTAKIGNIIQNANTHTLSATLNMSKFYQKTGILNLATKKKRSKNKKAKKKDKSKDKKALPARPSIGNTRTRTTNRKNMTSGQKIIQGFVDVVTAVKNIKVAYTENNGTLLPGYKPKIGFLGRDNTNGGLAPTLGFVFGSQTDIRNLAITNKWLEINDDFSQVYSNTHYEKLDINADVKPFKNLNIELSANKIYANRKSQQIATKNNGELDENFPFNESGNFSISYFMLPMAFDGNGDATFEKFKANRAIIQERLARRIGQTNTTGYGENSSEVLLPAFLATYSGQSPSKVKLNAFRNTPIPNWRLNYKGFMQMPWFKRNFRSFVVEHRYNSTYSIMGYTNNLLYNNPTASNPNAPFENPDINGNYQPKQLLNGVSLIEEFNPLVRVDMRMRNNFSLRAELKRDKALNLNLNNNTLTEIRGTEYVFGLGYRIKDVKLNIRTGNTMNRFKGDINLKADIGLRNNATVIRSIDIDNNQITGGQKLLSIKFIADYALNKNLLASFFYDQNSSRFLISNTFPRNSISSGITLRYTIGN